MTDKTEWDEIKRADMEKDALDDLMESRVICDNCGEEIGEDDWTPYYQIDEKNYCEVCILDCRKYT